MIDRFAWPAMLALWAVIPLVVWARARFAARPAALYSAVHRAVAAGASWRSRLRLLPLYLRLAALALLAVALARPQSVEHHTKTSTHAIAIQLVLDRSRSMEEPAALDGQRLNRLEAAKRVVSEFVAGNGRDLPGRPGDLIGLIAFGTFADTLCPLVREHSALLETIAGVDIPTINSEGGTAIGEALALATARLKTAEESIARASGRPVDAFTLAGKAIVLLTDGENTQGEITPLQAAQLAQQWGIRIYAIGIRGGTRLPGGPLLNLGREVNESELTRVAELTGGRFWPVEDLAQLREVYQEVDRLETTEISTQDQTRREERFLPFAAAALALLGAELLLATMLLRRLP